MLKILSVDGGGVKGIIASRILQEIETRTQKSISQLFNAAIGTSTDGLIVLGLAVPDANGLAKYSAEDMVGIYKNDSEKIFYKSFLRRFKTGFGVWGAKYNRENLDAILKDMFGDLCISKTLYPTYIPVYSVTDSNIQIISTTSAQHNNKNDFYVKDVAGATTAAPTYFAPKNISNISGDINYFAADGGIYADDPEMISTTIVCNANLECDYENTILLSIGTNNPKDKYKNIPGNNGTTGWLNSKDLIDDMIMQKWILIKKLQKASSKIIDID